MTSKAARTKLHCPPQKLPALPFALTNAVNKKNFIITRSADATDNLKQMHLVATMHQQLVYMANIKLTDAVAIGGAIPTEGLPTGVMQVTLFSSDWTPLAERICFVNNNDALFEPKPVLPLWVLASAAKIILK